MPLPNTLTTLTGEGGEGGGGGVRDPRHLQATLLLLVATETAHCYYKTPCSDVKRLPPRRNLLVFSDYPFTVFVSGFWFSFSFHAFVRRFTVGSNFNNTIWLWLLYCASTCCRAVAVAFKKKSLSSKISPSGLSKLLLLHVVLSRLRPEVGSEDGPFCGRVVTRCLRALGV